MSSVGAVKDALAFMDCPSREVADEYKSLLCKKLVEGKDSLLITGLMQYFLESNSPNALDLLLTAPPHHDRHVLTAAADLLKRNRFQVSCMLFHGLRRNPAPSWLRLLPRHAAIRDLLHGLDDKAEPTNIVAGVMVAVALVTAVPSEVGQHCLNAVLEAFWRLLHCMPVHPHDSIAVFLRVTLFSLFTRLYALYPCNLVNFIRNRTINQFSKPFFAHTLRPMIERVRLHPLLFTYTKEAEMDGKMNNGRDSEQVLIYSSRLSLDPVESSCERPPLLIDPEVCSLPFVEGNKCWVHTKTENGFWSPTQLQSPYPIRVDPSSSALHTPQLTPITTPIYARTPLRVNVSLPVPESPPEAAIEATPETTPYTTPLLSDLDRQILAHNISQSPVPISDLYNNPSRQLISKPSNPKNSVVMKMLSAVKKDRDEISTAIKERPSPAAISKDKIEPGSWNSSLASGVRERNESNKENIFTDRSEPGKTVSQNVIAGLNSSNSAPNNHESSDRSSDNVESSNVSESSINTSTSVGSSSKGSSHSTKSSVSSSFDVGDRSRKKSVFVPQGLDMLQFTKGEGSSATGQNMTATADPVGQKVGDTNMVQELSLDLETEEFRKLSTETCGSTLTEEGEDEDQGLGPPPPAPYLELMKYVRLNRVRFLSQCGPPLDEAQIESIMPAELKAPNSKKIDRPLSRSCTNLCLTTAGESRTKKVSFILADSSKNSMVDAGTQTQGHSAVDPYEKLTESFIAMTKPSTSTNGACDQSSLAPSAHELLENYIKRKIIDFSEPLFKFDPSRLRNADEKLLSQVHAMFCLLLLERQKREIHADRNRRLLATSKRMHEQAAEKTALSSKLEAFLEEIRDLKLHNQYMASCYEKMKETQDKENVLKEAVLKEQGLGVEELNRTVVTSLSRTVKTSVKGEETKEKVVVVLHRQADNSSNQLKDDLFRCLGAMDGDLHNVKQESAQLRMKVSELEQNNTHLLNDQVNTEKLQSDQEAMQRLIAVAKCELTLKDELSLVLDEQLREANQTVYDLRGHHRLERQSWLEHERKMVEQSNAMLGVTGAATLRLNQLEQQLAEQAAEHERELSAAVRVAEEQRANATTLEDRLQQMSDHNAELEARLKQAASERDLYQKELHLLKSRTGYSRAPASTSPAPGSSAALAATSSSVNSSANSDFLFDGASQGHFAKAVTSELKPLLTETPPPQRNKK